MLTFVHEKRIKELYVYDFERCDQVIPIGFLINSLVVCYGYLITLNGLVMLADSDSDVGW